MFIMMGGMSAGLMRESQAAQDGIAGGRRALALRERSE